MRKFMKDEARKFALRVVDEGVEQWVGESIEGQFAQC